MRKKCTKYQSLFLFRDSEKFLEHLKHCEDCQKMHEEMEKIEKLVKFSKPSYQRTKKVQQLFQTNKIIVCFVGIFVVCLLCGNINVIYDIQHRISHPEIAEYTSNSIFNKLNLPTDEFGLLNANREFHYE